MSEDGRNVDVERSKLTGFAAQMVVESTEQAWPLEPRRQPLPVLSQTPPDDIREQQPSYYGMPVVKPPPWKWYIPAYFYVGGAAGSSAALAAAAQLANRSGLDAVVRNGRWTAAIGYMVGASLLIADLGRPSRFLNMLRVFRPSSPMSVGTWLLSTGGAASAVAALAPALGYKRTGAVAGAVSGLVGLPLSTYTGVLLANTAVPLWKQNPTRLPVLFGASAAASAASVYELLGSGDGSGQRVTRTFSIAAKAAEVAAVHGFERKTRQSRAGQALRSGPAARKWRSATALGLASLATTVLFGKSTTGRLVAGALGTASAVALRMAVVQGGIESARDPRATFEHQAEAPDQ